MWYCFHLAISKVHKHKNSLYACGEEFLPEAIPRLGNAVAVNSIPTAFHLPNPKR